MKAVFWCQTYGPRRDCVARMLKSWLKCPAYARKDYRLLVWDNTGGRLAQWLLGIAPKIAVFSAAGAQGPGLVRYSTKPMIYKYVREQWDPDYVVQLCDDFVWNAPDDPDVLIRYMERHDCVVGASESMRCVDEGNGRLSIRSYTVPQGETLWVDAVHGSCMGLPRRVMDPVGYPTNGPHMPEWYPWGDDIAYGLRAHGAGFNVVALGLRSCHTPGPGPRLMVGAEVDRTCEWLRSLGDNTGLALGWWTEAELAMPLYQPIHI